ncbi:MAG: TraR/DksA C4-type zinc finger protein [Pseudomonadota bacterium]
MTPADEAQFRARLEHDLKTLVAQDEDTSDRRAPVELDQTSVGRLSRMDAMQMQAMAAAQSRRRGHEMAKIRAALDRLDQGTFGLCVRCEEDIEPKRLNFDAATPLCLSCASGKST